MVEKYDTLNQKPSDLGKLIKPRMLAGSVLTSTYLYVFGGSSQDEFKVKTIERHNLIAGSNFEVVPITDDHLLLGISRFSFQDLIFPYDK